jgi:Mrp family chromosome partitioning ATPase
MSRNFELLAQLDARFDKEPTDNLPFPVRPAGQQETAGHADSAFEEAMLRLVQRVFLSDKGSAPRQIVFCGVDGENGSTSVCAGAARTLAAAISQTVCVVDANRRSPGLSSALGIPNTSSMFQNRASMREGCAQIENNLWFGNIDALAGEMGPLPHTDKLKDRLTRLRGAFDFVLIDVAGTNLSEDAAVVSRLTGAALLVVDANRTRRVTARRAMETLETASGITVLGTVLYNRSFPIPGWVYKRL